jgi:hypothetical protein
MADDDLYFSFGDEDDLGEDDEDIQAEESSNRGFMIAAGVLGALLLIGICAAVALVLLGPGRQPAGPSPNQLTNEANMTLFAATQTADALTLAAPPVEEPQGATIAVPTTQAPPPSPTPTSGLEVTTEGDGAGTAVAEAGTPAEGTADGAGGGEEGDIGTPTALVEVTQGSGIIEVTPLGGAGGTGGAGATPGTATATQSSGIIGGSGSGGATQPSGGSGGPIQPTSVATLPVTGFAGTASLAGAGALALALVGLVAVVRKLRMK